jgi:hypothetical protein
LHDGTSLAMLFIVGSCKEIIKLSLERSTTIPAYALGYDNEPVLKNQRRIFWLGILEFDNRFADNDTRAAACE